MSTTNTLAVISVALTLGVGDVDDLVVVPEEVDLLNTLDVLQVHLLERGRQLLVVAEALHGGLVLAASRALATGGGTANIATKSTINTQPI